MKNFMRVFAIALLLAGVGSAKAQAQEGNWFWGLQYMVTTGMSDTKEFVSGGISFRNFAIEGRYATSRNLTLGMYFAWNVFNHETDSTITNFGGTGADVSGFQHRYVNAFPILATAHYYFGRPGGVRAYAGGGVGTYYIENRLDIGRSALVSDNWHLGLAPEVGVIIPVDWNVRAYLNVKYNWALKAGGVEHTFFGFGLGFAWM
ncbi:MAG: outer membrane beta-barrel protein [Gemmatimonadota bacterium]|nr:MAG: outer membrane beta-barrel protein [Gemmatimonadota bacterium]